MYHAITGTVHGVPISSRWERRVFLLSSFFPWSYKSYAIPSFVARKPNDDGRWIPARSVFFHRLPLSPANMLFSMFCVIIKFVQASRVDVTWNELISGSTYVGRTYFIPIARYNVLYYIWWSWRIRRTERQFARACVHQNVNKKKSKRKEQIRRSNKTKNRQVKGK